MPILRVILSLPSRFWSEPTVKYRLGQPEILRREQNRSLWLLVEKGEKTDGRSCLRRREVAGTVIDATHLTLEKKQVIYELAV